MLTERVTVIDSKGRIEEFDPLELSFIPQGKNHDEGRLSVVESKYQSSPLDAPDRAVVTTDTWTRTFSVTNNKTNDGFRVMELTRI